MITHEQAAIIRTAQADDTEILQLMYNGLVKGYPATEYGPTEAGAKAVAEYDAHYITIEREEIERLQALERKIEAFFGMMDVRNLDEGAAIDIRRQVDGKWYDVYVERGTSHWLAVKDFGLQFEVSKHEALGDAMRKAFELFEVPGVEAQ